MNLDMVHMSDTMTTGRCCQWYSSLSVLLSAMETSRKTQTALMLARCPPSEIICIRAWVRRTVAVATIQGWRLFYSGFLIVRLLFQGGIFFHSELLIVWLLFEGGVHLLRASDCAATIPGRRLFESSVYSKKYGCGIAGFHYKAYVHQKPML